MAQSDGYTTIHDGIDRDEWLHARRTGIGASEAAAVLGESPYGSPISVYADKIDPDAPFQAQSERMEWGNILEAQILERFETVTKFATVANGALVRSVHYPFMLATVDGWAIDFDPWRPVDAKNTQDGAGWSGGVPKHVWIQMQHQMVVTDAVTAYVAVLIRGCEFKWAAVERNEDFIDDTLVPQLEEFWLRVEKGGPPPDPDGNPATKHALSKLYPDEGKSIVLDGEFTDLAFELFGIKQDAKHGATRREEIENEIRFAMKDANTAALPDGSSFTWRANKNGVRTLRYQPAREV